MHPSILTRIYYFFSHFTQSLHFILSEGEIFSYVKFFRVWIVFIFGKEDMFLAQSLINQKIALFLVFSSRKTLPHRFNKSRSYSSGKLKRRRETDMQTEIEAKQ